MEERLIAAACLHSQSKQIAILSPIPPTAVWRRIAKKYGKSLVHVPLAQFSDAMIAQLRTVHVLNGKEVRSYAAHFIRKS
jgi:predicted phosphoribosyltransferase